MLASTTQNIYGVYDMSGGSYEYVMGNMVNSSGSFSPSSSGFSEAPGEKYYDSYTYSTLLTNHGRGKLGDATKETLKEFGNENGGWYNDRSQLPNSSSGFFVRGLRFNVTQDSGIFAFSIAYGHALDNSSSRAILVK